MEIYAVPIPSQEVVDQLLGVRLAVVLVADPRQLVADAHALGQEADEHVQVIVVGHGDHHLGLREARLLEQARAAAIALPGMARSAGIPSSPRTVGATSRR